jgi:tRNA threonylcarbamoyladenosine biosynthesis protein TsaB
VRVLGIETATSLASVGIVVEDRVAAERAVPMRGSHARTLLPLIDDALHGAGMALRDLDRVAVSIGPGSFTGLRIGLSVAKGLALADRLAVVGVPTLDAYARAIGPRDGLVCPVLDARKGEVYAAAFRWQDGEPIRVVAPIAIAPGRFAAHVQGPCTLVGDGVDAYAALWAGVFGERAELVPFAALPPSGAVVAACGSAGAACSPDELAQLEPSYCRPSEAEVGRGRLGTEAGPHSVEKLTGGRG